MSKPEPFCPGCRRFAEQLVYIDSWKDPDESRTDYIWREEGTLNPNNGHFLCDSCYIKAGQPSSPIGWRCP